MHFLFTSRVYYLETHQVGKHHRQFLDFFFFSRKFSRHGVKFLIHAQFNLIQELYWMPINLCFQLVSLFPASRGLSRRDKLKRQERDLCRLPTSFLSRMTTSDVFVTYDTIQRTGLNLSASASGC